MYKLLQTNEYKKKLKKLIKNGYNINKMKEVVDLLVEGKPLPPKYKDHPLKGNFIGFRECHVEPDWLLIYKIQNDILILTLVTTGTHSELF